MLTTDHTTMHTIVHVSLESTPRMDYVKNLKQYPLFLATLSGMRGINRRLSGEVK